jgi:peptidoglycan/LPS O-acetylase OafA/YrhL
VCLFFLISGFVITHSTRRESLRVFALRRAFRILPPLAVAIAVVWVLDLHAGIHRPWGDYVQGLSLMGYFTVPQIIALGVAWTLVIEVIFCMLMAAALPLFKLAHPAPGTAVVSAVTVSVTLLARHFGDAFFLFAASVAYLPVLLIGSALYLRKTACVSNFTVAALILVNCGSFMLGLRSIHTAFLPLNNSYLPSLAYAAGIFVVCVGMGAPKMLRWVGDISYSLYLLHGTLGFFAVQQALSLGMGPASPRVATALCLCASCAMYHAVERPAIALGKRVAA